ncbi:MAG: DNA pilot protein [Wigfec virus K19_152]|nr:MAG: DNA pilot protein [Wigfec virus K19_152]
MKKIIKYLSKIRLSLPPEEKRLLHHSDMFGIGTAVGAIIGGIGNDKDRQQQKKQNREQRQFELDQWNRTNAYNSPVEQMARLKAGGLNPNLVYGNGATTTAQNFVPSKPNPIPARNWGETAKGAIESYQDLTTKEKQKDLLEVQAINTAASTADTQSQTAFRNTVGTEEAIARKYSHISNSKRTETLNEKDRFELEKAQELRTISMDAQKAKLEDMQLKNAQEKIKLSNLPEQQKLQISEAYQRLLNAKSTMTATQLENALKAEQLKLRKQGIEVNNSPIWKMFSDLVPDVKKHNSKAWNTVKDLRSKAESVINKYK